MELHVTSGLGNSDPCGIDQTSSVGCLVSYRALTVAGIQVLPENAAAEQNSNALGQSGVLQNAAQLHPAPMAHPVVNSICSTTIGPVAGSSLGPLQPTVPQLATQPSDPMAGMPPQPQAPKRRFLARVRSKGISWHRSLGPLPDGAGGEGVGASGVGPPEAQGGSQGKGWRGRKRPSPPTPWPRRRSPVGASDTPGKGQSGGAAWFVPREGPPRPVTGQMLSSAVWAMMGDGVWCALLKVGGSQSCKQPQLLQETVSACQ